MAEPLTEPLRGGVAGSPIDAQIDEKIRIWSDEDWNAFFSRYMAAQFGGSPRPRSSIPAQPLRDDDFALMRVIAHARANLERDE